MDTITNTRFFTYNLYLGVKVTQNVAQYLLHNMTYAPIKFEVNMSRDTFTRNYIIWPLTLVTQMLPSTLYIMWPI